MSAEVYGKEQVGTPAGFPPVKVAGVVQSDSPPTLTEGDVANLPINTKGQLMVSIEEGGLPTGVSAESGDWVPTDESPSGAGPGGPKALLLSEGRWLRFKSEDNDPVTYGVRQHNDGGGNRWLEIWAANDNTGESYKIADHYYGSNTWELSGAISVAGAGLFENGLQVNGPDVIALNGRSIQSQFGTTRDPLPTDDSNIGAHQGAFWTNTTAGTLFFLSNESGTADAIWKAVTLT